MLNYPARIEADPSGGFVVTFRDIPEALTQGYSLEEAKAAAIDALVTAMDFYFEDARQVPPPSKAKAKEVLISLPTSVATKVLLLNTLIQEKKRPVDLAKAMHVKPQEVTRLLDLHHTTKIDTLAAAFHALGRNLDIRVTPAHA
ncbi:type II toxin-antitoxin system HicB family antitoxin [Aquabacterium sp.]|uniref:type II toxin-antitoxin system HicB family antitoxin n=1 Tax=Aquabacterium sp. TaxID=1872578 RepID=UPI0035B2B261